MELFCLPGHPMKLGIANVAVANKQEKTCEMCEANAYIKPQLGADLHPSCSREKQIEKQWHACQSICVIMSLDAVEQPEPGTT